MILTQNPEKYSYKKHSLDEFVLSKGLLQAVKFNTSLQKIMGRKCFKISFNSTNEKNFTDRNHYKF